MKKRILFAGVAGISIAAALAAKSRNDLVGRRGRAQAAYAALQGAFANRREWVPPALASVKGTFSEADYERQSVILTALIEPNLHVGSEAVLTRALPKFFELASHYGTLGSDRNFLEIQEQLKGCAAAILAAQRYYKEQASEYNAARNQAPASLVARLTGLLSEEGMDIGED